MRNRWLGHKLYVMFIQLSMKLAFSYSPQAVIPEMATDERQVRRGKTKRVGGREWLFN